jgi:hypothetical protein
MKKLLFIILVAVSVSAQAQETKNNHVLGLSAGYTYSNAVVLDLTQKDQNGIILGFGASRTLTKQIKTSAFAVLGYEVGKFEVKSRFGLVSSKGVSKAVYGGVVSVGTTIKKLRCFAGYDNYNKFQSGIGLAF